MPLSYMTETGRLNVTPKKENVFERLNEAPDETKLKDLSCCTFAVKLTLLMKENDAGFRSTVPMIS